MAPAARLAAYKVCWEPADHSGAVCGVLETVLAIDDAVADGVDVLNYSVGGATSTVFDLVNQAFLQATAAGVFVAAAAGNTPGAGTVNHAAPWVTSVAASTHDRTFTRSLALRGDRTYTGPGMGPAVPNAPLVDSITAALPPATASDAELCRIGALDPAKVTGRIVVCQRGGNARTDKSHAVAQAGGVGMILYNPTENTLNADYHAVPTIHIGPADGAAIKRYIASRPQPSGSLSAGVRRSAEAPAVASFSSQGPAVAGGGDLLKPDLAAPGVDVVAPVAPGNHFGNDFDAATGTSMASPHVAGVAALLKSKFPTWSPMAIKSALLTTASQVDNQNRPIQRENATAATPFDLGAGNVAPKEAFDPGLVYDSEPADWLRFVCGAGEAVPVGEDFVDACPTLGRIDPSDLNYPSIAVGDLAGRQTVTRTVTNTTNRVGLYLPELDQPAGFRVKVTPPVLVVLPNRTASYRVEITRTRAAFGQFAFGSLTWRDFRGHAVRSPIAVRAVPIAAPAEVTGAGTAGSAQLAVRAGFDGTLTARPVGLVPSTVTTKRLSGTATGFDPAHPAAGDAVATVAVTVPVGTTVARFATYGSQYPAGTDLDLYVYSGGRLVGQSAGNTADEQVTLYAGSYEVYLVQYATVGASEQDVQLHTFIVPPGAAGNLTATPATQAVGTAQSVTVTAGWTGLTAGRHYLGQVEYGDGTVSAGTTLVVVHA